MSDSDAPVPFRQASRLVNAFQNKVTTIGMHWTGTHPLRLAVALVIWRNALRYPANEAISFNGIATSLNLATSTVRRAVFELCENGVCVKASRGARRSPTMFDSPGSNHAGAQIICEFKKMLGRLEASGIILPNSTAATPADRMAASLDIYLSSFELNESRTIDPMVLHMLGLVTVMNAATLTHDSELGLRYGYDDTIPPDSLRIPVTVQQIAEVDGFPYATVWRHIRRLEAGGILKRIGDSYLLTDFYMRDPTISAASRKRILYVQRTIRLLAKGGYLPQKAA